MSALASSGALWFTVFTGSFTAEVFIAFLVRLARQAGRKVHVIADRYPVHCSKKVAAWLAGNNNCVELHLMPGYGPELNADIKHHVHAARARSADDLAHERPAGSSIRPPAPTRIVRGYFHARHVRYTLE